MRLDKLTIKAQEAVQNAKTLAEKAANPQIELEHLLLALLKQGDSVTMPLLQKLGVNVPLLTQQIHLFCLCKNYSRQN